MANNKPPERSLLLKNLASLLQALALSLASSLLLIRLGVSAPGWPYSLLFYTLVCFTLNLANTGHFLPETLAQRLLAGIVIKLLLSLIVIVVCKLVDPANFPPFAVHFIIHYILFTIFETRYLLFVVKNKQQNTDKS